MDTILRKLQSLIEFIVYEQTCDLVHANKYFLEILAENAILPFWATKFLDIYTSYIYDEQFFSSFFLVFVKQMVFTN